MNDFSEYFSYIRRQCVERNFKMSKPRANKESIFNACAQLYKQHNNIDEITHEAVTTLIGAKGNNQKTFALIKEWKENKVRINSIEQVPIDEDLGDFLAEVNKSLTAKNNAKLSALRDEYEEKLQTLEFRIDELQDLNQELQLFKSSVNPAIEAFKDINAKQSVALDALQDEVTNLREHVSAANEHIDCKSKQITDYESQIEISNKRFIVFTNDFKEEHQRIESRHREQLEQSFNQNRLLEMRLEESQSKYSDMLSRNSVLTERLQAAESSSNELREKLEEQTETLGKDLDKALSLISKLATKDQIHEALVVQSKHFDSEINATTNTTLDSLNALIQLNGAANISTLLKDALGPLIEAINSTRESNGKNTV